MAKRKTPKVTNLRPEKITDEQLKEVQQVISASNQIKLRHYISFNIITSKLMH